VPNVHNIGSKYYVHRLAYPSRKFPLWEKGTTQEIDYPYRDGECLVVRLPLSKQAVCVGRWGEEQDEEEALTDALGARNLTPEEREALDVW
jgi:hypothetical protein